MYTLGINAAFHDPAACLVKDGVVIAAAEDERFTHIKHGKRPVPFTAWELPYHAIDYCLAAAGLRLADIDHVAYSYDPALLLGDRNQDEWLHLPLEPSKVQDQEWESVWDPLFLSYIVNAPRQLVDGWPHHLEARFKGARQEAHFQWHHVDHHLAHEASAFLASPFQQAAIMTLDGRGEKATTSYGIWREGRFQRIGEVQMPHSLGLLYEQMTSHLGFLHSSDEYKVMALASYGRPVYADQFREMIHLGANGQYTIDLPQLAERFAPPRRRGAPMEQKHFDIAHSLQLVLTETVMAISRWLQQETGEHCLAMAGGVALNCVMNGRLRAEGPFREIWVQPAAGDAGTALGAALWIDARVRNDWSKPYTMDHAYLGPSYDDAEIETFLKWAKLPYRKLDNIASEAAAILAEDKVIGWFQGRMEFGPRALGARSILASPIHAEMQARLNDIKDREDFRPVAPAVLEEAVDEWFVDGVPSPFMLFVHGVRPEMADQIPAVRHVDGTARIQTVNRRQHPLYYDLIKAFADRTGVPVLVNTSFNTRGEPIVCTPRDAIESYLTSPLDALVIGSFLLEKERMA